MKGLKFEFKRFYSSKRNLILLGLFVIVLLIPILFQINSGNDSEIRMTIKDLKMEISVNSQQYQLAIDASKQAPDDKGKAEDLIMLKKGLDKSKAKLLAFQNEDYATYWKLYVSGLPSGQAAMNDFNNSLPLNASNAYNLYDHIRQYYHYIVNNHLYFYASQTSLTKSFETVSLSFLTSFTTLPILLITILSTTFFSECFEKQTIRFYQLINKNKTKILTDYFLVPFLTFLGLMIGIFVIFYIFLGVTKGWGSPIYPYGHGAEYTTPFWKLDLIQLLFLVLGLAFVITLSQLLTIFFKKALVVVGIESLLFISYSLLIFQISFQPFKKFLPFPYLDGLSTTIYDKSILFRNQTFLIGAIYLIVSILIFSILTKFIFDRYIFRNKV